MNLDYLVALVVVLFPQSILTYKFWPQRTYSGIKGVKIQELCIDETDLTTQRMLSLMAVKTSEEMPLYLHSITRILRVLRIAHQISGKPFHYGEFKKRLMDLRLTAGQEGPLIQRLDTLESFMPIEQRTAKSSAPLKRGKGTDWSIKVRSSIKLLSLLISWLIDYRPENLLSLTFHVLV